MEFKMNSFPLELIDAVYGHSDIDTKLALRKAIPGFRFTTTKLNQSHLPDNCKCKFCLTRTKINLPIKETTKHYSLDKLRNMFTDNIIWIIRLNITFPSGEERMLEEWIQDRHDHDRRFYSQYL